MHALLHIHSHIFYLILGGNICHWFNYCMIFVFFFFSFSFFERENKIVALDRLGLYYIYLYLWQIVITCIVVNFTTIPQKVVLNVKYLSGFVGCLSNWGLVIHVCGCWWRIIRVLYTIFLNKENFDCFGVGKCSLVPQFLLLVSFED